MAGYNAEICQLTKDNMSENAYDKGLMMGTEKMHLWVQSVMPHSHDILG